ncbi:MAG: SprB repeat-containing protein, partial [Flavobacteriales bacterium]
SGSGAVTSNYNGSQISCNGATNGQITVTATGGTGSLQYSLNGGAFQSSNVFSGLAAGTYAVSVKDANNCTFAAGNVTITAPAVLAGTTTKVDVLCNGAATGSVNLTVTGGTAPYTYLWSNAAVSEDLSALTAGTYNVTITDINNCTASASAVISQPAAVALSTTQSNILCNGATTGAINLSVSGGVSPYTYAWSNGATTEDISGLAAGTYTVTVNDANGNTLGCTATASVTITQPAAVVLTTTQTDVLCNGASSGAIDLSVSGGTSPYTYSWSNGATTQDISSLAAGTYTVTVTDANGLTSGGTPYFNSFSTTWLPSGAQSGTLAGTVDMQNGWTTRDAFTSSTTVGKWDQQVKQVNDANGNRQVFRMSNALATTGYTSQVFSETSAQVAGETNAALWNNRGTIGSSP